MSTFFLKFNTKVCVRILKNNKNKLASLILFLLLANPFHGIAQEQKQLQLKVRDLLKSNNWDKALQVLHDLESSQTSSQSSTNKTTMLKTIQWVKSHVFILKNQTEPARIELSQLINDDLWGGDAAIGMAKIAFQDKNYDEALQLLNLAEAKKLTGPLLREIIFQKMNVLIQLKKWSEAKKYISQKTKFVKSDSRFADWLISSAKVELENKNYKKACDALKKIYVKFPTHTIWGATAPFIKGIEVLGSKISCDINDDLFSDRRKQLVGLGYPQVAQKEISIWIETYKLTDFEKDRLIAAQWIQDGNFIGALELYLKYFNTRSFDYSYMSTLASIANRAGESSLAVGCLLRASNIAALTRKPKQARSSLFQAALLSYQTQDYDGAQNLFEKMIRLHKKSKFAVESKWYIAWIQYLKGHYIEAASLMADIKGSQHQERIKYWLAMSFLKSNNHLQAYNLFSNVIESSSGVSFYSLASEQRIDELKNKFNFAIPNQNKKDRNPAADKKPEDVLQDDINANGIKEDEDTETEIAEKDSSEDNNNLIEEVESPVGQVALEFQDRLEKAHNLRIFGFEDYAQNEFQELEKQFSKKNKSKKLLDEYQEFQDYNRLSSLSHNLWQRQGAPSLSTQTRNVWESMYPQAFKDDVYRWGKEFSIAPGFIWGIMRAESHYRPWVISPVGALGLMQVMPFTGKKVADQLGEKDFDPTSLKNPSVAIKFGAKYMEKLSRNFQNSVPLMAAAYNAGPHRVQNWIYHFGYLDMDEWVEHIPFTETRNYVKRVVSNYNSYKELYGEKVGAEVVYLNQPIPIQINEPLPMVETW